MIFSVMIYLEKHLLEFVNWYVSDLAICFGLLCICTNYELIKLVSQVWIHFLTSFFSFSYPFLSCIFVIT